VTAARPAFDGWAKKTAYLRGQILYRAAEILQQRSDELTREVVRSTGVSQAKAAGEVEASIDRLVYWAGWSDKFTQVFGSVNPVATSHFNFSVPEPTGVVGVIAPDEPSLLALVSLIAPVIATPMAGTGTQEIGDWPTLRPANPPRTCQVQNPAYFFFFAAFFFVAFFFAAFFFGMEQSPPRR